MVGTELAWRPLVIGGMHRSGTSLTASLLARAGLAVGDRLLPNLHGNTLGHYEDVEFLQFHERVLGELGLGIEGYTTRHCEVRTPRLRRRAWRIVAQRTAARRLWGWKEPRTVLFLDFWRELLPDARHLFVFRSPWEVADSLYRRGDRLFVADPVFALHVWLGYNRQIIDFIGRHPANCMLVEIGQVIDAPADVLAAVRSRLGLPVGDAEPTYRARHFIHGGEAALVREVLPEAYELYQQMCRLAGCRPDLPTELRVHRPEGDVEDAIHAWARRSRTLAAVRPAAAA